MKIQNRRRRSIRLKGYDYTQAGGYFVTVCTQNRECLFGEIADGEMVLNEYGTIVADEWRKTAQIRNEIELGEWVVMPNHMHGIVIIISGNDRRGTARRAPTEQFGKPVSGSLPTIIRSFKSAVTRRINELRNTAGAKLWQRNYYEHIIRNDDEYNQIVRYIRHNPINWNDDKLNDDTRYAQIIN